MKSKLIAGLLITFTLGACNSQEIVDSNGESIYLNRLVTIGTDAIAGSDVTMFTDTETGCQYVYDWGNGKVITYLENTCDKETDNGEE